MAAVLSTSLILTQSLEDILKNTFGPSGLDVMLTSSSGNILITNSGAVILKSLSVSHPVGRMIVDKIVSHCGLVGDGSSSFVLILAETLRTTVRSCDGRPVGRASTDPDPAQRRFFITMSRKFTWLEASLGEILDPILARLAVKIDTRDEGMQRRLLSLVRTTLCGNFPSGKVTLFTNLLAELLFSTWSPKRSEPLRDTVQIAIENFPNIFTEFPGVPVTSSKVLPGIVIPREFATDQRSLDASFKFVVLDCPLDSIKLQTGATLELKSAISLDGALTWKRTQAMRVLNNLKKHGVQLILSSESVADFILHFCRQLNICVVQMIPPECTELICTSAQIMPLGEFVWQGDSIAERSLGSGAFCRRIVLGQQRCVQLGVQADTYGTSVHSVLVCGPAQGICQQYSIALLGALKCIRAALDGDEIKLVPGAGATEVALSHELEAHAKTLTDPYEALACRLLSKGLLAVPKQLHRNSHSVSGEKKLLSTLSSIEAAWVSGMLLGIDARTGDVLNPSKKEIFEPFSSKCLLNSHVLQCVAQLLRTDELVGSARVRAEATSERAQLDDIQ